MDAETDGCNERITIHRKLLDAVKACQVYLSGKRELVTESSSWVSCLCSQLETALQHNLKIQSAGTFTTLKQVATGSQQQPPNFWSFVKNHLPNDEIERVNKFKNVTTDQGRGRAWLRCALNERSLGKYLNSMVNDAILLRTYYEKDAFMYDEEIATTLPQMAAGLETILFNIKYDDASFDAPTLGKQQNLFPAAILPNSSSSKINKITTSEYEPKKYVQAQFNEKVRRRLGKKKKAKIIKFDEDDGNEGVGEEGESGEKHRRSSTASSSTTGKHRSRHHKHQHSSSKQSNRSFEASVSSNSRRNSKEEEEEEESLASSSHHNLQAILHRHASVSSAGHDLVMDDWAAAGSREALEINEEEAEEVNSSSLQFHTGSDLVRTSTSSPSVTDTKSDEVDNSNNEGGCDEATNFVLSLTKQSNVTLNNLSLSTSRSRDFVGAAASNDASLMTSSSSMSAVKREAKASLPSTSSSVANDNENSALNANELHQALMAVMHRKDELAENNKAMRLLLDQEMEQNAQLRGDLDLCRLELRSSKEDHDVVEKEQEKENQVLRNQLKKYVGAVQALQQHGTDPASTDHHDASQPPPRNHVLDVSEAEMYEKKLIDVTEMHGELMEFNERLLSRFKIAMNVIRNMKAELVDLRGPMPSDDLISRIESDNLESDERNKPASRALINIWMPSIYLLGKGPDAHHVYQVYVRIGEEEWNVYRRYSHFHELHIRLRKKFPIVDTFEFPPKRVMGNKGKRFVEDRRKQLQMYLRLLMNGLIQHHEKLVDKPDKETLIALLPFFSETSNLNKEIPEITTSKRIGRNNH